MQFLINKNLLISLSFGIINKKNYKTLIKKINIINTFLIWILIGFFIFILIYNLFDNKLNNKFKLIEGNDDRHKEITDSLNTNFKTNAKSNAKAPTANDTTTYKNHSKKMASIKPAADKKNEESKKKKLKNDNHMTAASNSFAHPMKNMPEQGIHYKK